MKKKKKEKKGWLAFFGYFNRIFNCPRRNFAQKAKSRGGPLVTRADILTVEIYSLSLSMPEKISRGIGR